MNAKPELVLASALKAKPASQGSREVKCNPGDFLWAISPESAPRLLGRPVGAVVGGDQTLEFRWRDERFTRMEQVLQVSITAIDRDAGLLVVDGDPRHAALRVDLLAAGLVDLSTNVVFDPVARDFFTKKLRATLEEIGNLPRARAENSRWRLREAEAYNASWYGYGKQQPPPPEVG